ncbi:MAG: DUF3078 domain-containing protein, partial [Flavobacteriales bacterium]|nr:DUF3078 domain-containing protein [Flavobacteriales bacterium]
MKNLALVVLSVILFGSRTAMATQPSFNLEDADTVKAWTFGGFTSLQLNQVALVNWNAGGENSFSGIALANVFANYKKGLWVWDTRLDLGFGQLYSKT